MRPPGTSESRCCSTPPRRSTSRRHSPDWMPRPARRPRAVPRCSSRPRRPSPATTFLPEAARSIAEPADGDAFERVGAICRRHRVAVLYGFIERDGEVLRNTVQLLDLDGAPLVRYRKTHLWGELDRSLFVAGDDLAPLVELDGWRIGLLICYDVEFPETVRRLALEGAELVLVPTALMSPFTFVADHLVRVRAAENGVFLAYANAVGEENGLYYLGHSAIVGPDGEDIARAGDSPVLLRARLERSALGKARAALPYLAERRTELYVPRAPESDRAGEVHGVGLRTSGSDRASDRAKPGQESGQNAVSSE